MKIQHDIDNNELYLHTESLIPGLILSLGVIVFICGFILQYFRFNFSDIIIGFSIVIMALAALRVVQSYTIKIIINAKLGVMNIIESSIRSVQSITLPLRFFSNIVVCKNLLSDKTGDLLYSTMLLSEHGTCLELSLFKSYNAALDFAEKLQSITGYTIVGHDNTNPSVFPYTRIIPPDNIIFPKHDRIGIIHNGSITTLRWKNSKTIISFLLVLLFLYGLYYTGLSICNNYTIPPVIHYVYMLILLLGGLSAIIFYAIMAAQSSYIRISPKGIEKFFGLFGKKWNDQFIPKEDFGIIMNTIDEHSKCINFIRKKGLEVLSSCMQEGVVSNNASLQSIFRHSLMTANTSTLTFEERLFIEIEILKKLW